MEMNEALYQSVHRMANGLEPLSGLPAEAVRAVWLARAVARGVIGLRVTTEDLHRAELTVKVWARSRPHLGPEQLMQCEPLGMQYQRRFLALAEAVGSLEACQAELHRHVAEIML